MSFLGKFPYLSKCCIWINLRAGCVMIGFFTLLFHLLFFMVRDIMIVAYMKEALDSSKAGSYAVLSLLVIQTIFMRLPGIVISVCLIFTALMRSILIMKINVWASFYILTVLVIGVLLEIAQLFNPRSEYFVAIILFDLLLFVFLNYFFLIVNSYYHYLLGIRNAEREAVYATLHRRCEGAQKERNQFEFQP